MMLRDLSSPGRCWVVTLFGALVLVAASWNTPANAQRLIARTDFDGDGNFVANLVAVARQNARVVVSAPVQLNPALPAGATIDRMLPVNGGKHVVYIAFTGDAASFDDLFVVEVARPGIATQLNGEREVGVDSPFLFAAVQGSGNVAYAMRNRTTGTDRLFVADVETPGVGKLVNGSLPAGATIGDMEMSPDGQTLVYRVDQTGLEPQIWLSFLAGSANGQRIDLPVPSFNYTPNEFQFSPDGRYFLWRGRRSQIGQPEPLRMVTLDSARREVSIAQRVNGADVPNEQVFEFEIDPVSENVYYRSIGGDSSAPGNTFRVALDNPRVATLLNPAPVAGAGFTAQEDVLIIGDRVLYNSAQDRPDLVELYSAPLDGSGNTIKLSGALALNQISGSTSLPGVSHMVASRQGTYIAVIDGEPGQNLFVVRADNPAVGTQPFNFNALATSITITSQTNRTRRDPFSFSSDEQFVAILADPPFFDPEVDPPDVGSGLLIALPDEDSSGRQVFSAASQSIGGFDWLADRTALAAAVLPSSRSGRVGDSVSAFVAMINGGAVTAEDCRIGTASDVPVALSYQPTNAQTNAVTGKANTPVDVAPGAIQTWLVTADLLDGFAPTEVNLRFGCSNADPVPALPGINTLLLSGSFGPVPDMVALAATPTQDGILNLPGANGSAAFSLASINVGSAASVTIEADTSGVTLPISVALCETNAQAQCINPAQATTEPLPVSFGEGQSRTFSVFVGAAGVVPDDAVRNRIRVIFRDSDSAVRGASSVSVRTQ